MLSHQQFFEPNPYAVGAGSWESALGQQLYDNYREKLKGMYPWDVSVYLGICKSIDEHNKKFGCFWDKEEDVMPAMEGLPAYNKEKFIICGNIMVTFNGYAVRKVRNVINHKNGYAIYFDYADDIGKHYYQKLTCNHDNYIPFDDNPEFEEITSYVINDIPASGRPAYEHALKSFKTDLKLNSKTMDSAEKINWEKAEEENIRRKKILDSIDNVSIATNTDKDMPKYYNALRRIRASRNWERNNGYFYGRVTARCIREYAKNAKNRFDCYLPDKCNDDDIIVLRIQGDNKIWEPLFAGGTTSDHCFMTDKKIELINPKTYYAEWTVEHELGMDLVDEMVLIVGGMDLYEIDTEVHNDVDWFKHKINQNYYGTYHIHNYKKRKNK